MKLQIDCKICIYVWEELKEAIRFPFREYKAYQCKKQIKKKLISIKCSIITKLEQLQIEMTKIRKVEEEIKQIEKSWCGSMISDDADYYYNNFQPKPVSAIWDSYYGLSKEDSPLNKTRGDWKKYSEEEIKNRIYTGGELSENEIEQIYNDLRIFFEEIKNSLLACLERSEGIASEESRKRVISNIENLSDSISTPNDMEKHFISGILFTPSSRPYRKVAAHLKVLARVAVIKQLEDSILKLKGFSQT